LVEIYICQIELSREAQIFLPALHIPASHPDPASCTGSGLAQAAIPNLLLHSLPTLVPALLLLSARLTIIQVGYHVRDTPFFIFFI